MARENKRNREHRRLAENIQSLKVQETQLVATSHSGPLPDPDTLNRYNQLIPGLADRIVTMAEQEAAHRRTLEGKLLDARIDDAKSVRGIEIRGQRYALIISCVIVVGGLIAICLGHPISGSALTGATLVSLAGLFIYGRERKIKEASATKETTEKSKELANA